jgi:hypothetical protein
MGTQHALGSRQIKNEIGLVFMSAVYTKSRQLSLFADILLKIHVVDGWPKEKVRHDEICVPP